jgi:hypothetical protein
MKPLAHILPPYRRGDDVPVGVDLPATGAASAMLIDEGALNRFSKILDPLHWTDEDNSHPPAEAALRAIATVLRAPAKNDMGASPVHAIIHVETLLRLRDHVTAAHVLRKYLPKSTPVSIGMFPGPYTPADEAWADAAAMVDSPCYCVYPSNAVCRGGLPAWLDVIRGGAKQLKAWFPKRRKWIGFLTPGYQVWGDDPEIAPMAWTPTPIPMWEAANVEMRDVGFTPFFWAPSPPYDASLFVEHIKVFCGVWGLKQPV